MYVRILLCLCVLSLVAPPLAAQGLLSLEDKIRSAVSDKEPLWELSQDRAFEVDQSSGVLLFKWRSHAQSVEAVLLVSEARESALKNYRDVEHGLSFAGTKMRVLRESAFTLGEERFVWEAVDSAETKGVIFIKGRVFVFLKTQDAAVAKKIAEEIAAQIPDK